MTENGLRTQHSSYVDLDPSEYEYATSIDLYPDEPGLFFGERSDYEVFGTTIQANNWVHAEYLWARKVLTESATSAWNVNGDENGRCDHCGANLRYVVVLKHTPTDSYVAVGETCHQERFGFDSKRAKDVDRLRKRALAARVASKHAASFQKWLDEDPANEEAFSYAEANREGNSFYSDLLIKAKKYGPWSDRQRDAVLRGKVRDAEHAEKVANKEVEPDVPCPEGRYEISGTVVKTEWKENDYGGRLVFTVKDDRGFLVWGSVPSALSRVERDDKVKFTAAVTRSDTKENFGFFKRPTKASLVEEAQ